MESKINETKQRIVEQQLEMMNIVEQEQRQN